MPADVAGMPGGWFVAVVAAVVLLLLALAGRWLGGRLARDRVLGEVLSTRQRVGDAVDRWVTGPVDSELAAHAAWRQALEAARSA